MLGVLYAVFADELGERAVQLVVDAGRDAVAVAAKTFGHIAQLQFVVQVEMFSLHQFTDAAHEFFAVACLFFGYGDIDAVHVMCCLALLPQWNEPSC